MVRIRCAGGHPFAAPSINEALCPRCGWRPPRREPTTRLPEPASWVPSESSRYRPSDLEEPPGLEDLLDSEVHIANWGKMALVTAVIEAGDKPLLETHHRGTAARLTFKWGPDVWWQAAERWIVFRDAVAYGRGHVSESKAPAAVSPRAAPQGPAPVWRTEHPHSPPSPMNPPTFP